MKKLGQKGFSIPHLLLILVALGIIGGVGYYVYRANQDINKNLDTTVNSQNETQKSEKKPGETTEDKKDVTVHKVNVKMQTSADIDKLPDYTPDSFKTYMLDLLKKNKYSYNSVDGVDTISQYHIDKISQVNIVGGFVPVDKDGEGHAGGAPIIWVLTPKGTWDQETLNGPLCESKNGGLIYEEFVEECYQSEESNELVKNPNGSIETLND